MAILNFNCIIFYIFLIPNYNRYSSKDLYYVMIYDVIAVHLVVCPYTWGKYTTVVTAYRETGWRYSPIPVQQMLFAAKALSIYKLGKLWDTSSLCQTNPRTTDQGGDLPGITRNGNAQPYKNGNFTNKSTFVAKISPNSSWTLIGYFLRQNYVVNVSKL